MVVEPFIYNLLPNQWRCFSFLVMRGTTGSYAFNFHSSNSGQQWALVKCGLEDAGLWFISSQLILNFSYRNTNIVRHGICQFFQNSEWVFYSLGHEFRNQGCKPRFAPAPGKMAALALKFFKTALPPPALPRPENAPSLTVIPPHPEKFFFCLPRSKKRIPRASLVIILLAIFGLRFMIEKKTT